MSTGLICLLTLACWVTFALLIGAGLIAASGVDRRTRRRRQHLYAAAHEALTTADALTDDAGDKQPGTWWHDALDQLDVQLAEET